MVDPSRSTVASRHDQTFPALSPAEVGRLRRFGEPRSYDAGACIVKTGEVSPGFFIVLAGEIASSNATASATSN